MRSLWGVRGVAGRSGATCLIDHNAAEGVFAVGRTYPHITELVDGGQAIFLRARYMCVRFVQNRAVPTRPPMRQLGRARRSMVSMP